MQILFGQTLDKQFEIKVVEIIRIKWSKQPKKFMIYTWKPGFSWNLWNVYDNYQEKISELSLIGQTASAIMIVMEESYIYPELNGQPAYGIESIYIGYNALSLKSIDKTKKASKYTTFDLDQQFYRSSNNFKDADSVMQKLSQTFEQEVSVYKTLSSSIKYVAKAKSKAQDMVSKLNEAKDKIGKEVSKKLMNFIATELNIIRNPTFVSNLQALQEQSFIDAISNTNSNTIPKFGSEMSPALDCLEIKKKYTNPISGFYYIQPECAKNPVRIFCDFTLGEPAVDILIFNDYATTPNPDLSYLDIVNADSIKSICGNFGLYPINIKNKNFVTRISDLLSAMDYDLSTPFAIPLGYDYSCDNGRCTTFYSSINDRHSLPIMEFFNHSTNNNNKTTGKKVFSGLGFSDNLTMLTFDPLDTKISAVVCSSNHFKPDQTDSIVKDIDCSTNVSSNSDTFRLGSMTLVRCPGSCHLASGKIYGTGIYHGLSSVCKAAIHSGILSTKGGKVNVSLQPSAKQYTGTTQEGVTSIDIQPDNKQSFALSKYTPNCPKDLLKQTIEGLGLTTFTELEAVESEFDLTAFDDMDPETINNEVIPKLKQMKSQGINVDEMLRKEVAYNKAKKNSSEDFKFKETFNPFKAAKNFIFGNKDNPVAPQSQNAANPLDAVKNSISSSVNTGVQAMQNAQNGGVQTSLDQAKAVAAAQSTGDAVADASLNIGASNLQNDLNAMQNNMQNALQQSQTQTQQQNKSNDPDDANAQQHSPTPPNGDPDDADASEPKAPTVPLTTETGIGIIKSIRQASEWDTMKQIEIKSEKIKAKTNNFSNQLAWSSKGSQLSIKSISDLYQALNIYKTSLMSKLREIAGNSKARVEKTKRLKEKWDYNLNKLKASDPFNLDMSKDKKILFDNIFTIYDMKSQISSNWDKFASNIKGRTAIGQNSMINSAKHTSASMLVLNNKEWYDMTLEVDILIKDNGTGGIAFRVLDSFNYYALIFDKVAGYKAIIKVVNGIRTDLQIVNDGGLIINDWHKVKISLSAANIYVSIFDLEQLNGASQSSNFSVVDYTFVKGSVGFFVNGLRGFFFDAFSVVPNTCWSPWTPKTIFNVSSNVNVLSITNNYIINLNSNIYIENFKGLLNDKWILIDIENGVQGPGSYVFINSRDSDSGIKQTSIVYDNSSKRQASMLILKNKILANGQYKVTFNPTDNGGFISVIFKYSKEVSANGQVDESFYAFDSINNSPKGQFILKKYSNGQFSILQTANNDINGLPFLGYKSGTKLTVFINCLNDNIFISVASGNSPSVKIFSIKDTTITRGLVGIGTFKTRALFSEIELMPPRLQLTDSDKKTIMSSQTSTIPIPSITAMHNQLLARYDKTTINKMDFSSTENYISNMKNMLGSTLGMFSVSSTTTVTSSSKGGAEGTFDEIVRKLEPGKANDPVICHALNSPKAREGYCARTFNVNLAIENCKNSFCDTCCTKTTSDSNGKYTCIRSCEKAETPEIVNEDYVNTCIETKNPLNNIYRYCDIKYKEFDANLINTCKQDVCNLCCATMDPIKHKNYSIENQKNCYLDCEKSKFLFNNFRLRK